MFSSLLESTQVFITEYGLFGIFLFSCTESFINPIPVATILLFVQGTSLSLPLAFALAFIGNILGAVVGYVLGVKMGHSAAVRLFGKERIQSAEVFFQKWGELGILIAAFTPFPFKVACWSAGIFNMSLWKFFVSALVGRAAHFLLVFGVAHYGWKAFSFFGG